MNELGEWLRYARETRGLTLEDAERDTRISRRYLYALESGELDLIPAPVYARGFLRSYAQYLGLDPQEAMARYPRDDAGPYASQQQQQRPPAQQQRQQQQQQQQEAAGGSRPRSSPFGGPREPSPEQPQRLPGNRPNWRRPGPGGPESPAQGRLPPQLPAGEPAVEPMIGVDIGVPVPARRLQQDPAAQTRSMVVLGVALVAVLGIVALAFLISRLGGGGDGDDSAVPTLENGETSTSGLQTPGTTPTAVGVTGNGVVPSVIGELQADAVAAIQAAGLEPVIRNERNAADAGTVITQSPDGGTQMEPGDPVTIIVSEGP